MNLPESLSNAQSWTLVGPLGPELPPSLSKFPVMAVDGGAKFAKQFDFWIGDSDSLTTSISKYPRRELNPTKNSSDLSCALEMLSSTPVQKLHLWGFLGGRRDHELFNLGECLSFLCGRNQSSIDLYDANGKISFKLFGPGIWELNHTGLFSVGALHSSSITLTGDCIYPILSATILTPLSSFGLSNVASGKIQLTTSNAVFMFFPEEP